jgi:cytochrome c oxidase subunit 2
MNRGRIRVPSVPVVGAVVTAAVVTGCMPAPATEGARAVSDLWTQFLIAAALVGGLVWGLMTIAIVRFRRRPAQAGTLPPQIADAPRLEMAWTIGPIVIVDILFLLNLGALGRIDARSPSRVTVDISAFRWQWQFAYEGSDVTVAGGPDRPAELVLPAGEPIHLVLTSADVAHSFYVPAFLFKRDAIPGRTNEFDLTIPEPGTYGGQCAEFCGVYHDRMELRVVAVSRPEFDAWLAARATGSGSGAPDGGASGGPSLAGSPAPAASAAP